MLKPSFILSLAGLQQCLYRLLPPHWHSLHKDRQCGVLKTRGGNTAPCQFSGKRKPGYLLNSVFPYSKHWITICLNACCCRLCRVISNDHAIVKMLKAGESDGQKNPRALTRGKSSSEYVISERLLMERNAQTATIVCYSTGKDYSSGLLQANDMADGEGISAAIPPPGSMANCHAVYARLPYIKNGTDILQSNSGFRQSAGAATPFDEFQASVQMLDYRGATIHPVSAIDIQEIADLFDGGAVDVPANHTVQSAFPYRVDNGVFKVEHE